MSSLLLYKTVCCVYCYTVSPALLPCHDDLRPLGNRVSRLHPTSHLSSLSLLTGALPACPPPPSRSMTRSDTGSLGLMVSPHPDPRLLCHLSHPIRLHPHTLPHVLPLGHHQLVVAHVLTPPPAQHTARVYPHPLAVEHRHISPTLPLPSRHIPSGYPQVKRERYTLAHLVVHPTRY